MSDHKEPNLTIPRYSSTLFTWRRSTRSGVADASDLGVKPGAEPDSRVWNDACDTGFIIRSHVTGNDKVFTRTGVDGAGWIFTSKDGVEVIIFND